VNRSGFDQSGLFIYSYEPIHGTSRTGYNCLSTSPTNQSARPIARLFIIHT